MNNETRKQLIQSVTAVLCVAGVCISAVSVTDKVADMIKSTAVPASVQQDGVSDEIGDVPTDGDIADIPADGEDVTAADGTVCEGIGLGSFTSVQGRQRFVEDVYGTTDLYGQPMVGFMNKCSIIEGVETPLLTALDMGFGNSGEKTPEGFRFQNVLASELTGPILVKNPRMLEHVVRAIYARRGQALPEELPRWPYAEEGYAITEAQLKLRWQKAQG